MGRKVTVAKRVMKKNVAKKPTGKSPKGGSAINRTPKAGVAKRTDRPHPTKSTKEPFVKAAKNSPRNVPENSKSGQASASGNAPGVVAIKNNKKKGATPVATAHPTQSLEPISQDPIQFPEDDRPIPKTSLSDVQLEEFRDHLLAKRAQLAGDMNQIAGEVFHSKGQGYGDHSSVPVHMADLGSDNWEQEFSLGLIANERALVQEIDQALARIRDKTYGICLATHNKIGVGRLRAKPWAKYCIEYERAREEGRVR